MKTCNQCQIKINTHQEYCPLCHQTLEGVIDSDYEEIYPFKKHEDHIPKKTINIFFFLGAISIIVLGVINLTTMSSGFWSLIPIIAIIYIFILIRFSILSKVTSMKRFTVSSMTLFALLLILNHITDINNMWSVDYILPSIIMTNNFTNLLIMLIQNRDFRDYALNLLTLILFSLIPFILYLTGLTDVIIMPILTLAQGLCFLLFMLIFYPRILKEVLKKTFHI